MISINLVNMLRAIMILAVMYILSCSSGDDPKPVDCDLSDLNAQVSGSSNPASCTSSDGSIQVSATGGKGPYQFKLNNGSYGSQTSFTGLGVGSYTVTVKDANGCEKDIASSITLTAPGAPQFVSAAITADTQCSADNGSISITASGGSGAFTYSKDGTTFQSSNVFSNLRAGTYIITIKDDSGCSTIAPTQTVGNGTDVDYDNDILPIFRSKCDFTGCHPQNGNWFDYNTAKGNAQTIKTLTGNGTMPKGGASAPNGALSTDQINLIACWVDHGAPKN